MTRPDHVILVDEHDTEIGTMPKLEAHRPPGHLHRAISIFVIDSRARILLQRRAPAKYHFPALWTNTCCSHPRPGEPVEAAGRRRLREEMGLDLPSARVGTFLYEATDPVSTLVERELDHVLLARTDSPPTPDPSEADAWLWTTIPHLRADLTKSPSTYTPWLPPALTCLLNAHPELDP